jgi:hypothetical protein
VLPQTKNLIVELHANLSFADSTLQRTSTPIPRGALSVEIYQRDLLTEAQKLQFADMPNYETNVAGVTVPLKVRGVGDLEREEMNDDE